MSSQVSSKFRSVLLLSAHNPKPEHLASVVRSEERRVTIEQVPIVTTLQSVDIRSLLPSKPIEILKDLTQFIVCDSENKLRGNTTAANTYEWVFQFCI